MTSKLLAGVRIIEAAEAWAGPAAASMLGDLGADVIKLESFPRNSITRPLFDQIPSSSDAGPPWERSGSHHLANRNKRNVAINLRTEGGAEAFRRLLATADVFIEGYSAGTMERLGFGWKQLHDLNPRLVMISIPGWGVEGPYQGFATLGSGLDAATGHVAVRGYPDRGPEWAPSILHSDATGALSMIVASVAGLRRREATGEGCFIDLSQAESFIWQVPGLTAEWTMNGREPPRLGNADPHIVPHGCYRAAGDDRWVVVAAESDQQWAGLAALLGHPEWATDGHPWASVVGRLRAREEIDEAIAEFCASREAPQVADEVQAAGAIAAPVVGYADALASPQLHAREWFQTVHHRYAGENILTGFCWSIPEDPPTWDRPCGLLGEYNEELLTEVGYSAQEIEALQQDGAIGNRYPLPTA